MFDETKRRPRRRAALLAAAAALAMIGAAERAGAAEFYLGSGEIEDGEVARFGDRFLAVRTGFGFRVIDRGELRAVGVSIGADRKAVGRLADWRSGGIYHLSDGDGALWIAREGALMASMPPDTATAARAAARADAAERQEAALSLRDPEALAAIRAAVGQAEAALRKPASNPAPAGAGVGAVAAASEASAAPAPAEAGAEAETGVLTDLLESADAMRTELASVIFGLDGEPSPAPSPTSAASPAEARAEAYLDGAAPLLGDARAPAECVGLASLAAPPPRGDGDLAMRLGVDRDIGAALPVALAQAYYAADGAAARLEPDLAPGALWRAAQTAPARLARPAAIVARKDAAETMAAEARAGGLGVRLTASSGDGAVLIGFEPLLFAVAEDVALESLTPELARAWLSGAAADAPRLYLPPQGSPELEGALLALGLGAATPAAADFIADADARAAAAAADPAGVALLGAAASGGLKRLRFGEGEGERPTAAGLADGRYPLARPVYLAISAGRDAHPLSSAFARFSLSPLGAAALGAVGLAPVSSCADGACRFSAPGLAEALDVFRRLGPVGAPPASRAPSTAALAAAPASVDGVLALMRAARGLGGDRSLSLRVDASIGADAPQVQAAALALRCAGARIVSVSAAHGVGDYALVDAVWP